MEINNNKNWAFHPIRDVSVPQASNNDPIKWFILKSLKASIPNRCSSNGIAS